MPPGPGLPQSRSLSLMLFPHYPNITIKIWRNWPKENNDFMIFTDSLNSTKETRPSILGSFCLTKYAHKSGER